MFTFSKKKIIGAIIILVALLIVVCFLWPQKAPNEKPKINPNLIEIGKSVQGRSIQAYVYGSGSQNLVFVGGIHGGYEWNSVLLAYQFIDYLNSNPEVVPANLTISVIPSANPDGVFKVIGKEGRFLPIDAPDKETSKPGRLNAHLVDLNRNFDCRWTPNGIWQGKNVSAGTAPFSEPEAKALRDYLLKIKPIGTVFWHSQSNAVYASACNNGILPETLEMMNLYAQAGNYPAVKTFDSYVVTGAIEDWLASVGIPAITVELKTHETIEWEKNLPAILALIKHFGN